MVSKIQWKPFWLRSIHKMTGLVGNFVWAMTYLHRPKSLWWRGYTWLQSFITHGNFSFIPQYPISTISSCPWQLSCPETLLISHENANFLFSVVRMVQGEAKTPKIMGCCRANFAFLPALKIGTFRGKWTLEWMFKTSLFARLALYFFNQQ